MMIFDENQVVFDLNKYEFLYPLHSAVLSGKFHVSQYMMENLEEKKSKK